MCQSHLASAGRLFPRLPLPPAPSSLPFPLAPPPPAALAFFYGCSSGQPLTGGGLVVHHAHSLDFLLCVCLQHLSQAVLLRTITARIPHPLLQQLVAGVFMLAACCFPLPSSSLRLAQLLALAGTARAQATAQPEHSQGTSSAHPQRASITCTSRPSRCIMSIHRWENRPYLQVCGRKHGPSAAAPERISEALSKAPGLPAANRISVPPGQRSSTGLQRLPHPPEGHHLVPGGEGVGQRGLPATGAGAREDEGRALGGAKQNLGVLKALPAWREAVAGAKRSASTTGRASCPACEGGDGSVTPGQGGGSLEELGEPGIAVVLARDCHGTAHVLMNVHRALQRGRRHRRWPGCLVRWRQRFRRRHSPARTGGSAQAGCKRRARGRRGAQSPQPAGVVGAVVVSSRLRSCAASDPRSEPAKPSPHPERAATRRNHIAGSGGWPAAVRSGTPGGALSLDVSLDRPNQCSDLIRSTN